MASIPNVPDRGINLRSFSLFYHHVNSPYTSQQQVEPVQTFGSRRLLVSPKVRGPPNARPYPAPSPPLHIISAVFGVCNPAFAVAIARLPRKPEALTSCIYSLPNSRAVPLKLCGIRTQCCEAHRASRYGNRIPLQGVASIADMIL